MAPHIAVLAADHWGAVVDISLQKSLVADGAVPRHLLELPAGRTERAIFVPHVLLSLARRFTPTAMTHCTSTADPCPGWDFCEGGRQTGNVVATDTDVTRHHTLLRLFRITNSAAHTSEADPVAALFVRQTEVLVQAALVVALPTLAAKDEARCLSCTAAQRTELALAQRRSHIVVRARDDSDAHGFVVIVVGDWRSVCDFEQIWLQRQLRRVAGLVRTAARAPVQPGQPL